MEGILGLLVPVSTIGLSAIIVFIVLYFKHKDSKNKYDTLLEVSKNVNDPSQIEALIKSLEEKKSPLNYKRAGLIIAFAGIGIYLLGTVALGSVIEGVGLLVLTIGAGVVGAAYIFPEKKG